MAERQSPGWLRRLWDALDAYGNIATLWQLVAAFGVSTWVVSLLPGGWHPPQYPLVAALAFFGAWLVAAIITRIIRWIWRWARPVSCRIEVYGGVDVSVQITNTGPIEANFIPTGRLSCGTKIVPARESPFNLGYRRDWHLEPGDSDVASLARGQVSYGHVYVMLSEGQSEQSIYEAMMGRDDGLDDVWVRVSVDVRSKPRMRRPATRVFEFRFRPAYERFEIRDLSS